MVVVRIGTEDSLGGERDVDGHRGWQVQGGKAILDSGGEPSGVVGVLAAFLGRERVPKLRKGFVGFVVYAISPGVGALFGGALAWASSLSSVNSAMSAGSSPQPGLLSTTR